ncbi:MAG: 2-oxoglutarate dehydrogenase, E2 component, dihydrolipoamide succinyltransferase [Terracidiphilus sp.]
MPTDVVMPQMGESIFEGTITKWLKKAGDTVEKDEPLFEISTDKVDAEIPSPVAGVLIEIRIHEGATVEVNTVVAVVTEQGTGNREQGSGTETQGPGTEGIGTEGSGAGRGPVAAEASKPANPVSGGTPVVMPQMGESIFEGTITKWLKKAGDTVEKDEPLFEISTDKVDAEIPSPIAGVLTEIKIHEGETVEVNTVVAVIGGTCGAADVIGAGVPSAVAEREAPAPSPHTEATAFTDHAAAESDGTKVRSSPLVRRIAKENNLDLRRIAGTGSAGRITKDDALKYLGGHGPGNRSAGVVAQAASSLNAATSTPAPPAAPVASTLPGTVATLSRMRAIIAERMVESKRIAPHVYSVYKVDMTRIVRLRERERSRFEQKHGVKLTFMPFIAAAAIEALRRHPIVNASLQDGSIHYHANINLGIAVALEWGLIVPVVKQAETLSFSGLARSMADLAERARTKKLKPEEATGSTFTLTNSGVFGGEFGTPIINQPESAILAIGGLKKEPVVITDAEGSDAIAIRAMQSYCLGFDHRLIDGADGGKFMSMFKRVLETWDREIG